MKTSIKITTILFLSTLALQASAQDGKSHESDEIGGKYLYLDVHHLTDKVKYEDVAKAHQKDLATEKKYGVHFIKFWVNEDRGTIYCLSSANDTESIAKTHAEAHGLMPDHFYKVTSGEAASLMRKKNLYLDVHYMGAGKVKAQDVAAAHQKDLAIEKKYGVNFINYWVDEEEGMVLCLSQANDSDSVIRTHKEAHGLLPAYVMRVKEGK